MHKEIIWGAVVAMAIFILTQWDSCNTKKIEAQLQMDEEEFQVEVNYTVTTKIKIITDTLFIYDNVIVPMNNGKITYLLNSIKKLRQEINEQNLSNKSLKAKRRALQNAIEEVNRLIKERADAIKINNAQKAESMKVAYDALGKLKATKTKELEDAKQAYQQARNDCP